MKVVSSVGLKLTAKKRKPTSMPFNLPGDEVEAASKAPHPVKLDPQHHESDYLESENFKSVVDHDQSVHPETPEYRAGSNLTRHQLEA